MKQIWDILSIIYLQNIDEQLYNLQHIEANFTKKL